MLRVRINLTGAGMGTGVNICHVNGVGFPETLTDAQNASDNIRSAWAVWAAIMAQTCTITQDSIVEVVESTSGEVTNEHTITPLAALTTSGAATFAAGVGARVRWRTSVFHNSRRVVGSTFVVPLGTTAYESNGTLTSSTISSLNTGATTLLSAMSADNLDLVVWHRNTAPAVEDGFSADVTSASIPDQVSWLKSRRT